MKPHPAHTNRLAKEKSPYLLQHAHNPVDWYPWGEEAFEKARREQKPIFLSIGYSTCHWCHVMEKESFENAEIAALMNEFFVSIKVDREERPDVDALYMQAVMQMTGRGGWPMSVFLTPDRKPFYGGTYFPPTERWGQPGFPSILRGVAQAWSEKRQEVLQSGDALAEGLKAQAGAHAAPGELTRETLRRAYEFFSDVYDDHYGGFAPAPKFPRSHALSLLLRYGQRAGDPHAVKMVEQTLQAMAAGGINDPLGGGFHRYSTDAIWHIPHFEKMLYDQALLARTYLEAYQATGKEEYARTAREIFDYVLRDMTGPEGGFYSAEDADSEGKEGAFYVWTAAELKQLLGEESAEIFGYTFGVREGGNAEQDPTGEFAGQNILHRVRTVKETAQKFGKSEKEIEQVLERARGVLFSTRARRPRPHLDDKILTDWNGLMISSLAFGSRVLNEPKYASAAQRSADFLLVKLREKNGRLLHRYRDGDAAIPAHLDDYAFLIHGLIDLYEATFEARYLTEAKRLTEQMIDFFWDEEGGGFFLTARDAEKLLVRQKEGYDGAIPSGNSVAALDLLRMGRLTSRSDWEEKASRLLKTFSALAEQNPTAVPQLLIAFDFALGPSREIVLSGDPKDPALQAMIRTVYHPFLPNKVVALSSHVPFLQGQGSVGGKATAYVCENYACQLPTADLEMLKKQLMVK